MHAMRILILGNGQKPGVVDEAGVEVEALLHLVTMVQMAMVSDPFY